MPRNKERRTLICDAGLQVLADAGTRGLTHRAIDQAAGVPLGTTGNYFPTRADLVFALVGRVEQRLQPDPQTLDPFAGQRPSRELLTRYLQLLLRRLLADRVVTLALFELRLEAARRPDLTGLMTSWLRANHQSDLAFHVDARLPGTPEEMTLVRFALEGLAFDQLTLPVVPYLDLDLAVAQLVDRLIPLPLA